MKNDGLNGNISESFTGWVGSIDDLKFLLRKFRLLKKEILADQERSINDQHVDFLRNFKSAYNRSGKDFLVGLDKQIDNMKKSTKLTLSVEDKLGNPDFFTDDEIDERLKTLDLKRIASFEIEISLRLFSSPGSDFGPIISNRIQVSFKASENYTRVSIISDSKDSEILHYLSILRKQLNQTDPTSKRIKASVASFFVIALAPILNILMVILWSTIIQDNIGLFLFLTAIHTSSTIFFTFKSPKWLMAFAPKFSLYSDENKSPAVRTKILVKKFVELILIPTLISLVFFYASKNSWF